MSSELFWDDEQPFYGTRIKAHFFDPAVADLQPAVQRLLPVFRSARPVIVTTETDVGNKNFIYGELIAQPDAVFEHGGGFICLEFKTNSGRSHDRGRWPRQLKLTAVLQIIAGAMAVACATRAPAAAMLRCHNVLYSIDPSVELLEILGSRVPAAKGYWSENRRVNITQLAEYCEALVKRRFGTTDEASAAAGKLRHETMLAR